MSKPRRSSVDLSRKPLKAHRPYRGDDFTQGKKTGLNVREVDRRSDGFESFGEVLGQADGFIPSEFRTNIRKRFITPDEGEDTDDENGVMSMDIEETASPLRRNDPVSYLSAAPRPSVPSSANRTSSTIRPGDRSYFDFDRIPSPRASTSHFRASGSSYGFTTPRRNSALSHSIIPSSLDDERGDLDESDNEPFNDYGDSMDFTGYDYDPPPETGTPSPTAAKVSFTEMDRDDEGLPPIDDPRLSSPPRRKDKGKQKESRSIKDVRMEDDGVEDDIARGLDEIEDIPQMEDEPEENYSLNQKRSREEPPPPKEKKKPAKRKKVQVEAPLSDSHELVDGVRRGTRTRYKPLEWWRCEKVVYGRRDSGTSMVPVIKDIIRVPKESENFASKKKRATSRARSRSRAVDGTEEKNVIVFNPEEGWDDATEPSGVVIDYATGVEVSRRLACTAKMVDLKPTMTGDFLFHKLFSESDFMAGGQMELPVGGKKPSKSSNDNSYMFYIIEGAINLRVHRTSLVLASGAMFLIPRGNNYYMENISQRPARLFFAQARKVYHEDDVAPGLPHANGTTNGSAIRRSRSVDNSTVKKEPPPKKKTVSRSNSVATGKKSMADRAKSR